MTAVQNKNDLNNERFKLHYKKEATLQRLMTLKAWQRMHMGGRGAPCWGAACQLLPCGGLWAWGTSASPHGAAAGAAHTPDHGTL